ncbi:hypothetical protein HanIR_Chr06g0263601 [Helianthus annuus]|nr:hypothetical protein HanIR_Chr06g0263601 [Helianthus annuus]
MYDKLVYYVGPYIRAYGVPSGNPFGDQFSRAVRHRQQLGDQERECETGVSSPKREGGERSGCPITLFLFFFFFLKKNQFT